eukprot:TRINITY_DN7908_c0_g1_i1.p1 TRINITY_DN7908_c0_g1~~TRINITY_DN7908_c0_g1_i1.p1  ORF type:complete len:187 (-),score=22.34 TRINITY_DN7908_c0_g1_i1:6-566(-)
MFSRLLGRSSPRSVKLRSFSTLPTEHYWVDTNILIHASKKSIPELNHFIEAPHRKFYFTDSVKKQFAKEDSPIHPSFIYTPCLDLYPIVPEVAFSELKESMKPEEIFKFKNDLFYVFEAGFVCYDVIEWNEDGSFLTNNMEWFRRFILDERNKKMLSEHVERYGLEHLIEVKALYELGVRGTFLEE